MGEAVIEITVPCADEFLQRGRLGATFLHTDPAYRFYFRNSGEIDTFIPYLWHNHLRYHCHVVIAMTYLYNSVS